MGNRIWIAASVIVWLLGLALALYIFLSYRNLHADLVQKNLDIAIAEKDLAQIGTESLYARDASYSTVALLNEFKSVCETEPDDYYRAYLEDLCSYSDTYVGLTNSFMQAAALRTTREPKDYEVIESTYRNLEDQIQSDTPDELEGWLARAQEGVAYAILKQGRLPEALGKIEEAERLGSNSGVVKSTDLKIRCQLEEPAEDIRLKYQAGIVELKAIVESTQSDNQTNSESSQYANLELELLAGDPELRHVCAYALEDS